MRKFKFLLAALLFASSITNTAFGLPKNNAYTFATGFTCACFTAFSLDIAKHSSIGPDEAGPLAVCLLIAALSGVACCKSVQAADTN